MYFKRLEINGFKSFADPVTIEFNKGITCIVGPNGSGKSNISDAIRWVLGEQSPKMLRGGKMEEVIFAGTQSRKAKGMAEVTLVIDNSDHSLPIEYTEVAITRRMYKSGDTEYLINRNVCRLRDIRELIMDTGIGVEGYSVIGQGKIADIVSNKMDSRREIFEEAAGVVKYRNRKEETLRKLETNSFNLSRVNDIIGEIENHIGKLKEDSEKASEYLEIKKQSRGIDINILLKQIEQADEKSSSVSTELSEIDGMLTSISLQQAENDVKLLQSKNSVSEAENKLDNLRTSLAQKTKELYELSSAEALREEKKKSLSDQKKRLASDIAENEEKLVREQANLESIDTGILDEQNELEKLNDLLSEKKKITAAFLQKQAAADTALRDANYRLEHVRVEQSRISSRLNVLEELDKSYEGYSGAVKFIMDRRREGIYGTLGSMLIVPRGYEVAIETELGSKLQNIVCRDDIVAAEAIELLKKNQAGRLTFLPVSTLKVQPPLSVDCFQGKKGFIGLASDIVKCEGGYVNIVNYVLGNVVLCDNLDNAMVLSRENSSPHKFVTLNGEIINNAGAMTGGSFKNNTSNILLRRAEKETLREKLEQCSKELASAREAADAAKAKLSESDASRAKEDEMQTLLEVNAASGRLANTKNIKALIEKTIDETSQFINSRKYDIRLIDVKIKDIEDNESDMSEALVRKQQEQTELEELIKESENLKNSAHADCEALENKAGVLRSREYELQQKKHDAGLRKSRFDDQSESLKNRIWDDFEMSYAQSLEYRDPDFVLAKALKESREYKDRLRALGDVNIGAIKEYRKEYERHAFMTAHRDDINKAIDELNLVIRDMDRIIKDRLRETFDKVAINFEESFSELFKGGYARLILADPDNPLESAIDIEAQPPGKKLQNMNLLSGGEKTLTAIALMFAVLKSRTTPFCILDEIEAALDENNIDTVAGYIRRFNGPQFALITHQKLTMEYADVLYGVTMPESGVTQVLSLKLGDDFEV